MRTLIESHPLVLIEAAIVERIRRAGRVKLHPSLVHAGLIYDERGREELEKLYQGYLSIAITARIPILLITPTWRANQERVLKAGVDPDINSDAVRFMMDLREKQGSDAALVKVGGFVGCKNDSYKPEEGLSQSEAELFHSWQINQLAQTGVDFLMAGTLPNVDEATGIAKAMAKSDVPYIISFVIDSAGLVLDGTSLSDAVAQIDSATHPPPLCYMVNCSYPTFLCANDQPKALFTRLLGFQANSSALSHAELEGSGQLHAEDLAKWAEEMYTLNRDYGLKILGGCCGTDNEYLRVLAQASSG
jgi:S-methylmethionine-dependent homocysteine/selenocysteine methylase